MPRGSGSSTKFSQAKRDRLQSLAVEIASIETRALYPDREATEDLMQMAGQLADKAFPFPADEHDPRRLYPLPHLAYAVLLIDKSKQEDNKNAVPGDTTFVLANNVLWQISRAVDVCQQWTRQADDNSTRSSTSSRRLIRESLQ